MIRIKLDELLAKKGMSVYRLAKLTQIDAHNLHRISKKEVDYIKFENINKLCVALNCRIEDLLEYVPDEGK